MKQARTDYQNSDRHGKKMWCLSKQHGHHWSGLLFSWGKLSSEQKSILLSQIMPLPCSWGDGRGEVTESTIILEHSDSSPDHWAVGQELSPWSSLFSALMLILHSRPSLRKKNLISAGSHLCSWSSLWLPDHLKPGSWTLLKWLSMNFFWLSDPRVYSMSSFPLMVLYMGGRTNHSGFISPALQMGGLM